MFSVGTAEFVPSVISSEAESNEVRLNFLALAWIALVNLMIQVFCRFPTISIAVILLSFRMLRV